MKKAEFAMVQHAQVAYGDHNLQPFASEGVTGAVVISLGNAKAWMIQLYVRPDDARRLAGASVVRVPALKDTDVRVELVDIGGGVLAIYGAPGGSEFYNLAACGMNLASALREVLT